MPLLICYVLKFSTPCAEWDDLAILLAGAFSPKGDHGPLSAKALSGCSPGVTWHPPWRAHSSRSCSCQLSNNINKKVDGPRRECTYGPNGLCRLSRGLLNYGEQYRLWKIIRQQPIAELENKKLHQAGRELGKKLTLPQTLPEPCTAGCTASWLRCRRGSRSWPWTWGRLRPYA